MKPQSILLCNSFLALTSASALPNDDGGSKASSPPNKSTISWEPCKLKLQYDNSRGGQDAFDCARLSVPLDYTDLSNGDIQLDLIRLKAFKKPSKGSVLYNPGGPGESGVQEVAGVGQSMLEVIGGHYDLIGFDTRGTGRTIPFVCNESESDTLVRRETRIIPETDTWEKLQSIAWKGAGDLADLCYKTEKDHGRFIGTPFIARDMLSIVEALDQGSKLNYWSTSYGSVLGQVFIAMFPDRVGRIVLDGVMHVNDYFTSTWIGSTWDSEKAVKNLFDKCVQAGPKLCSLASYEGKNTTGDGLMSAVVDLMEGLIGKPFPDDDTVSGDYAVSKLKKALLKNLYFPHMFPTAIKIAKAALQGNWTTVLEAADGLTTGLAAQTGAAWNTAVDMALLGISCSDSSFRVDNPNDLYSIYRAHLAQSSMAEGFLDSRLFCSRWKFSAVEQFDINKFRNINITSPVLLVNGIYDPVTPLSYAWEVSAQLRGSHVLIHEGIGHGLRAHPSNCTNEAVGKYFTDGEMPEVGKTCKPYMPAFEYDAWSKGKGSKGQ